MGQEAGRPRRAGKRHPARTALEHTPPWSPQHTFASRRPPFPSPWGSSSCVPCHLGPLLFVRVEIPQVRGVPLEGPVLFLFNCFSAFLSLVSTSSRVALSAFHPTHLRAASDLPC